MSLTATYDPALARVRLDTALLGAAATHATFDRSLDGVTWTTVRGALQVPVTAEATQTVDDYEFPVGQLVTYRVRSYDAGEVVQATYTATITVALDRVWLKVIARPFLNRPVTVTDFGDVERPFRGGIFDVVGRSAPVAVSDVRGSRRYTLTVVTSTAAEAATLDLVLASGDPLFVQVPADCPVPSMYAQALDVTQARRSTRGPRRYTVVPLVEVAAPGPDVVGATSTWSTVLATYATWSAVLAAHTSWGDLLELIGDPAEVVVP